MDIFIKKYLDMKKHIDKNQKNKPMKNPPPAHGHTAVPASFNAFRTRKIWQYTVWMKVFYIP